MPPLAIANGELTWFAIAGVFFVIAIPCAVLWIRSRHHRNRYGETRIGMACTAGICLAMSIIIAGPTVASADNGYKTNQAAYELAQQGFQVERLSLSEGWVEVHGSSGCLVWAKVITVPWVTGKWHTRVFALGAKVSGPQQIPCIGTQSP